MEAWSRFVASTIVACSRCATNLGPKFNIFLWIPLETRQTFKTMYALVEVHTWQLEWTPWATGKWFDHVKNETVPQLSNYIYVKRGKLPQQSNQIRRDIQYLFALLAPGWCHGALWWFTHSRWILIFGQIRIGGTSTVKEVAKGQDPKSRIAIRLQIRMVHL